MGTMAGRPGLTLTADQKRRLGELRDLEIAIGRADQGCREEMDAVRQRVRNEYEARFVSEHRAKLQELFPEAHIG